MLLKALDAVAAVVVGLAGAGWLWLRGDSCEAVDLLDDAFSHAAVRLGLRDDDDN